MVSIRGFRRLSLAGVCVVLSACTTIGTDFDPDQARKIRRGMTRSEVVAIMGSPPSEVEGTNDWRLTWIWQESDVVSFGARTKRVTVTFDERGRVDNAPPEGIVPYSDFY